MTTPKQALLLGCLGTVSCRLTRLLVEVGWDVTVTSRSEKSSDYLRVSYARGRRFLAGALARGQNVVDFMVWLTYAFRGVWDLMLDSCWQHAVFSSYHVFADSPVIDEYPPRLRDVSGNAGCLETDEYDLAKARQEDLLRFSGRVNWATVLLTVVHLAVRSQLRTPKVGWWLVLSLSARRLSDLARTPVGEVSPRELRVTLLSRSLPAAGRCAMDRGARPGNGLLKPRTYLSVFGWPTQGSVRRLVGGALG